jgi:hypothetical protein
MNVTDRSIGKKADDEFDKFVEQEIETVESESVLHKVCYPPHYDIGMC